MILDHAALTAGPGIGAILYGATAWVLSMLVVLFHREGIKVVGGTIVFTGFLILLIHPQIILSIGLIAFGLAVHWCGQTLYNLRRRG